jgi:hypothetical protein
MEGLVQYDARVIDGPIAIRLVDAKFCLSCDEDEAAGGTIYIGSKTCPRCGSKSFWMIARWLNRINGGKKKK